MARKTRNWSAVETTDFAGGHRKIAVKGEVQTLRSNEKVSLREARPQGTNPAILLLDVVVDAEGAGLDVLGWAAVTFEKATSARQYKQVTVTGADRPETFDVKEVVS